MTLVGFKARNHPQQKASDEVDDRGTPPEVFDPLDAVHHFSIDVAASAQNAKCARYYDRPADGLAQSWANEAVWCNPPYSSIGPWVAKAWAAHHHARVIVMLLPANRTEQAWWQDLVEPHRDRPGSPLTVGFLRGRVRFLKPGQTVTEANERPPFGVCTLTWTGGTTYNVNAQGVLL